VALTHRADPRREAGARRAGRSQRPWWPGRFGGHESARIAADDRGGEVRVDDGLDALDALLGPAGAAEGGGLADAGRAVCEADLDDDVALGGNGEAGELVPAHRGDVDDGGADVVHGPGPREILGHDREGRDGAVTIPILQSFFKMSLFVICTGWQNKAPPHHVSQTDGPDVRYDASLRLLP
jgi:hypothetical protein